MSASSNTSPIPLCCKSLEERWGRKVARRFVPVRRSGVEDSSRRVRRGGVKRGQFWDMSPPCESN